MGGHGPPGPLVEPPLSDHRSFDPLDLCIHNFLLECRNCDVFLGILLLIPLIKSSSFKYDIFSDSEELLKFGEHLAVILSSNGGRDICIFT